MADAADFDELVGALDRLKTAILNGWSGDQTLAEAWGWNQPAVTRHDIAAAADLLKERLVEIVDADISSQDKALFSTFSGSSQLPDQ